MRLNTDQGMNVHLLKKLCTKVLKEGQGMKLDKLLQGGCHATNHEMESGCPPCAAICPFHRRLQDASRSYHARLY